MAELAIQSKYISVPSVVDKSQMTSQLVKEPQSIKLQYNLDTGVNYDRNAVDHRITTQTLLSTPVDTCGQAVDSTFNTVTLNVQANYAIGVFKDNKLMLTPLSKFQQVRPSFEHVDKERDARQIKSKDQQMSERAAADKVTRLVQQKAGGGEQFGDVIDTEWISLKVFGS